MALHVQTDMRSSLVNTQATPAMFERNGSLTLEAMQTLVGGFIQVVNLKHHINVDGKVYVAMGMNEDGGQMGLPRNVIATDIGVKYGVIQKGHAIVGNVVLFEAAELKDADDE